MSECANGGSSFGYMSLKLNANFNFLYKGADENPSTCICTNISVKNLPKLPTEGKEPEWGISQGKRFNGALIRKFITFALDHNAYSLRSAITYSVRQNS